MRKLGVGDELLNVATSSFKFKIFSSVYIEISQNTPN